MFVLNKRLPWLVAIVVDNVKGTTGLPTYVTWHVVHQLAPKTLYPLPRAQFTDGRGADKSALGYMAGRCYTGVVLPLAFVHVFNRRWLAATSVRNATALLGSIRSVGSATIASLPWADAGRRRGAPENLATLRAVVAWLDHGSGNEEGLRRLCPYGPELSDTCLDMSLALHATELNVSKGFVRVHGPTSKEVGVLLAVVNDFYIPMHHVIVTPAAILYPPCHLAGFPSSYNLASLGHVMGHENTHAFDRDEALFGRHGLRRNWWTPASRKRFSRQVCCLRCLYNETPWTGAARYGAHALCENLAISGGLLKADRAYRGSVALQHSGPVQQGTTSTGEQLFASSCFK
ncbi:endothelin-converting enzyme 1-like [Haemaphysalis longicornis]|uniref:Peptidase M13 C-terminal domain-containing protein n=1 Tax=Haemaphysalis longicornis TaxID=44386 RepID=A0A9J6FE72_HAELO|nr:hypothetical protein HPB48_013427 [Haemaphysalis longicornis]